MMKVIIPNKIDLYSCSISESDSVDGTAWLAGATYAKGEKVRYEHVKYESLDDGNKGNKPSETWSGTDAKWKKIEATRPYLMLDEFVETQTKADAGEPLSFCVPYDRANAFALLNLHGYEARIGVYDLTEPEDDDTIYNENINLIADIWHLSLWEYNYLPITNIKNLAKTDLVQTPKGRLCINLMADGEDSAAIGHVVVGMAYQLGWTQYGAERSATDYSKKIVNEFGATTLVRRSVASRASLPIYLHPDQMDYVVQILEETRGTPCVWIGDNRDFGYSSLTIYGWLEDFRMTCAGPNENQLTLEIQGLI